MVMKNVNAPYYLQVFENKLRLTDTATKKYVEVVPSVAVKQRGERSKIVVIGSEAEAYEGQEGYEVLHPFADPGRLVVQFEIANKVVKHLFDQLKTFRLFKPRLIVHPMGQYKNWVSGMEHQFFIELGLSAGAREVVVYAGEVQESFDFDALKPKQVVSAAEWAQWTLFFVLLAGAAGAAYYAYTYGT